MIKLFSTGCPKCKVLKKKLEMANLEYEVIEDTEEVQKFAEEHDIHSAPFIVLDDNSILDFSQANKYLAVGNRE